MILEHVSAPRRLGSILAAICLCLMIPAAGADTPPTEWQITKCRVYSEDLERPIDEEMVGLSESFLDENSSFVGKVCTERTPVCPRTQTDLEAANTLTIAAMNAGAASSFLLFACVRP